MFSRPSRVRLWVQLVLLSVMFMLALVVMGTVGVNGSISFENLEKGCLLYIKMDDSQKPPVPSYNNGFCYFPIAAAAIVGAFSLVFLGLWIMVIRQKEEHAPRSMSIALLASSLFLTLFSFAITAEVGIGLRKGCQTMLPGQTLTFCHSSNNFSSLYSAQVSAGLMGGLWLVILILEWFNFKSRPSALA